jgi:hypothetical protein
MLTADGHRAGSLKGLIGLGYDPFHQSVARHAVFNEEGETVSG